MISTLNFWGKVQVGKEDECWPWKKALNNGGYGAHRLAYEVAYGKFDRALLVLHTCDNPPCCNPSHLFLGTHGDNMRDMSGKGRTSRHNFFRTHCPKGHEYKEENIYHSRDRRYCKVCMKKNSRDYQRFKRFSETFDLCLKF